MIGHDPARTYRAAIIGAGSGGLTLAIGLARFGRDVVLIESGAIGGDCTNVGCIPSKTLLHVARNGHSMPLETVRRRRDALEAREAHELEEDPHIHLVRGRGRLTARRDPLVVAVDGGNVSGGGETTFVRAEHVVVCTGSRPARLAIEGLPVDRTITNEELFELDDVPRRLLIVGGGPIGLEMATAFADLGTRVDVVERADRLLPEHDPLVSDEVRTALEARRIGIHTGTIVERFVPTSSTAVLASGIELDDVDRVLVAVGRRPRLEGLALDVAGVEHADEGIVVDTWGRTNVDGVFAVGDVTGRTATTHGANALGRRVVRAIAVPQLPLLGSHRAVPEAVFSRPEVASVGLTIDALAAVPARRRRRYVVRLADVDRGYAESLDHGLAVVDVERFSGAILRAAIVGPAAAELIGLFTMAIDHDIGLRKLFGMVHPYPAWAELLGRIADDFAGDTYPHLLREWWAMVTGRLPRARRGGIG